MKAYLAVTTTLFGLLTIVHVWRAVVEASARDPVFIVITVFSTLLCLWGGRLLLAPHAHPNL